MIPGLSSIIAGLGASGGGGPGPGGGSQRQVLVPGFPSPVYVATTAAADKQYALPHGVYKNEQGA